jgi:hypothetical protein
MVDEDSDVSRQAVFSALRNTALYNFKVTVRQCSGKAEYQGVVCPIIAGLFRCLISPGHAMPISVSTGLSLPYDD